MKSRSIFKEHFLSDKYHLKDLINSKLFLLMIKPAFSKQLAGARYPRQVTDLIVKFIWAQCGKKEHLISIL